jgi:uncharacterized protein (TIGR02001 family)
MNQEENMNTSSKLLLIASLLTSFSTIKAAEFESNVALSNDYVWRGMTQTSEEAAISGGFDISSENGLYFGTWASNVEFGDSAALELDWYTGFANELDNGLSYDFGYLSFTYPGEDALNFEEIYLGLGYSYFGLTLSAGQNDAPDNIEGSIALGETGLSISFGQYEDTGDYTLVSYDLPISIAGLTISIGWSDFTGDSVSGLADEDSFLITFSM